MPLPVHRHDPRASAPTLWEPFREMADLRQRMMQMMDSMWPQALLGEGSFSPPCDVEETDDAWLVEAELPGVSKDAVTVELNGPELSIRGQVDEHEHDGHLRRQTRRRGQFDYRLELPGQAEAQGVDASLKDGILTVRIPKPERSRPTRIEIKGADGNGSTQIEGAETESPAVA